MENRDLVQVYIKSVYSSQNNNNYRVIELSETLGKRVMRVVLGMFEADFIVAALNNKFFKRPMPYNVMNDIFKLYKIEIREIVIFGSHDNIIFSKIVMFQDDNKRELTLRISDALALAIEVGAPIYVERYIIDQFFQNITSNTRNNNMLINKLPLEYLSIEELNEELRIAADNEAYEDAAAIRDEIKKREDNKNNRDSQNTNTNTII